MASPLSPAHNSALNVSTPLTSRRYDKYEVRTYTSHSSAHHSAGPENQENQASPDGDSSPFMSQVSEGDLIEKENPPPPSTIKARPQSRIISGTELSPLKILLDRQEQQQQPPQPSPLSNESSPPSKAMPPPLAGPLSPRKLSSPIRRFPVKINVPGAVESPRASPKQMPEERTVNLGDAIRDNAGLKRAIEIFESEDSVLERDDEGGDTVTVQGLEAQDEVMDEPAGIDDTMMSTFSNFSAVPNLTMLSQMRSNSPSKMSAAGGITPRAPNPATSRTSDSGNTTNLMDFTEQLRYENYRQPMSKVSPSRTTPNLANNVASTPQRNNLVNLLDFDIPPMPTPRSIPTITPRELESLKSGFLSEISGLKATLSGKEAEVASLKTAVGDAEKRVGECMEQLREVQGLQETLTSERDSWEKRGREMEVVLRKVKEEIVITQREREDLEFKLDESEKRCQAAEMMAQDAESKMAGMRAGKASAEAAAAAGSASPSGMKSPNPGSNREVEIAVERVARELHALYKSKHETKVAALKKSYENRWEKKVNELRGQVDELSRENEEMRIGRDATMTRIDPVKLAEIEEERKVDKAKDAAHIKELEAEREKLGAVVKTIQADNNDLRGLLEKERVEKGELVQLAEEMMNMQTVAPPTPAPAPAPVREPAPPQTITRPGARHSIAMAPRTTPSAPRYQEPAAPSSSKRHSMLRAPTGLRPSATESRIGRMTHERTKSAGISNGLGPRSGIMSSIEKMGSYRGRGD